jgi:hypothetical protein
MKKNLPSDWLAISESDVNNGEGCFEWSKEHDPKWADLYNDWIIPMRCITSSDTLRSYNIKEGEVCGYAFHHKTFI